MAFCRNVFVPFLSKFIESAGTTLAAAAAIFVSCFVRERLFIYSVTSINANSRPVAASQMSHAEKRANHNAVERARRESLNIRFLELAQSIPTLVHVRKPSKSVIVSRSIEFIHETKNRLEVKTRSLQLLRQQNEEFKAEINRLRSKLGLNPVVFPDNIDLDLVYEANLEHQRDTMDARHISNSQHHPGAINTQNFPPHVYSSGSYSRANSPFDMVSSGMIDDDEEERMSEKRMPFPGSLISPVDGGSEEYQQHSLSGTFFL